METVEAFQKKTDELRNYLIKAMGDFSEAYPDAPAQVYTAALGETFVQFSMSHSGVDKTLTLIDYLTEAVKHFASIEPLPTLSRSHH